MTQVRLGDIAYARSGDKGSGANIGVIAFFAAGYDVLRERLTAEHVGMTFYGAGARGAKRYELPNLLALNFVLPGVLGRGGSLSLRTDAQGKALGQILLETTIMVPDELVEQIKTRGARG